MCPEKGVHINFELQKREDICERDTRENPFLKKTWENSLKTLKHVFLRFKYCLSTNFTVNVAFTVDYSVYNIIFFGLACVVGT